MNFEFIVQQIQRLSFEWFQNKKECFHKEPLYVKEIGRINDAFKTTEVIFNGDDFKEYEREIAVDVDLENYCWYPYFYGSTLNSLIIDEDLFYAVNPPINGADICRNIIEYVDIKTNQYTDATAMSHYLALLRKTLKNEVQKNINNSDNHDYSNALKLFLRYTEREIDKKYTHIYEQLEFITAKIDHQTELTPEKCLQIAKMKINEKRFVTDSGVIDMGVALLHVLRDDLEAPKGLKIRVEDWMNNDVYYLLLKLSEVLKGFSPGGIEHKKVLYLKQGKQFDRRLYDNFKSQKIATYPQFKKDQIDRQLKLLF